MVIIPMKKAPLLALLACLAAGALHAQTDEVYTFDKPLYGAAYYSEYTRTNRLDEDIRLMKEAGLTVVRVGESTWSLFEPQDGVFEFEWMDRIIDKMHEAGIKVILGTPTYSIPAWMAAAHPEVLSQTWRGQQSHYGIRQNMDLVNPTYRAYCERIIRKLMEHYAQHPAIIGYQVDNEVHPRDIGNADYFEGFRDYIKAEFDGDLTELNRRWGLNYWGMNINTWEEFYDRPGVTNPSYKVWWERWNRKVIADFLNWQADIVGEYKRPDQFITHCFMPGCYNTIDLAEAFRQMPYPAINVYINVQDGQDGQFIGYSTDFTRPASPSGNFLVTETTAQATGWDSRSQFPPYDGQLRQNMYAFLAGGANMVEYWHWATLHYGQETYWRGLIGQDGQATRVLREFARGAAEIDRIGAQLVNLKKQNRVALLYSHDSDHALSFMPYTDGDQYKVEYFYQALYRQNIECDIVAVDKGVDLSGYDLLLVPPLYVASDELLTQIAEFVKAGGEVVMLYKSGYTDTDNAVRDVVAPGPLAEACGFTYQEYANLRQPMALRDNELGTTDNTVSTWVELLQPTTATPLAYIDHHFYGRYPCITENAYGQGHLTYIATLPSQDLLQSLIRRAAERKQIATAERALAFPIILRSGVNADGKAVHYLFNYTNEPQTVSYPFADSQSLLDDQRLRQGKELTLEPWGVVIGIEQ